MWFSSHRISLGQIMHVYFSPWRKVWNFKQTRKAPPHGFLMDQEMVQWCLPSGLHQYFMFTENHFTKLSPNILAFIYSSLEFTCCICTRNVDDNKVGSHLNTCANSARMELAEHVDYIYIKARTSKLPTARNVSSVAVSKAHHLKAADILMLLSQNASMIRQQCCSRMLFREAPLNSLERGDFDWQVCVRIQFHSEWKFLPRSDEWTFDLRPTLKLIRYVFMHPGSAPALWAGAGGVDGSWFCFFRLL